MPTPYELATKMLGSHEHRNHSALTTYLKNGGQNLDPAVKAWCAALVNSSLEQAGIKGSGSDMARSLLKVGTPVDKPAEGDIVVLSRGDPKGPFGHTGFFKKFDERGNPVILGGNQSNAVTEAPYPADRVLGYRRVGTTLNSVPSQDPQASFAPVAPVAAASEYDTPADVLKRAQLNATDPNKPVAPVVPPGPLAPPAATVPTMEAAAPASSGPFAGLLGADGKGGAGSPFAGMMEGLTGAVGALSPKNSQASAELNKIDPISGGDSHAGGQGNPQMAAQLMAQMLQARRKNFGISLTG